MSKAVLTLLSILLFSSSASAQVAGPLEYGVPAPMDLTARLNILTARIADPGIGQGRVMVIGDSQVENLAYDEACGEPVVMFGVSGMRAHDLIQGPPGYQNSLISEIVQIAKPSVVVIALGINDLARDGYNQWVQDWFYVPLYFKQLSVPVVLLNIAPTEATVSPPLQAWNNPSLLAAFNMYTTQVGIVENIPVVDLAITLAPTGYLPPGSTFDGLHFKGQEAKLFWDQIVSAITIGRQKIGKGC